MISVDIYKRENGLWDVKGFCCGMNVPEMNDVGRVMKAVEELKLDKVLCQVFKFGELPKRKVCSVEEFYNWSFEACKD